MRSCGSGNAYPAHDDLDGEGRFGGFAADGGSTLLEGLHSGHVERILERAVWGRGADIWVGGSPLPSASRRVPPALGRLWPVLGAPIPLKGRGLEERKVTCPRGRGHGTRRGLALRVQAVDLAEFDAEANSIVAVRTSGCDVVAWRGFRARTGRRSRAQARALVAIPSCP